MNHLVVASRNRSVLTAWNLLLTAALGVAAAAACSAANGSTSGAGTGGAGGSAGSGATDGGAGLAGASASGGAAGSDGGNQTTVVIGPGADASAPGKFGGAADASSPIDVVYPESGILVPPNMNSLEIHFVPSAGQTLFELRFEAPSLNFVVYTGCSAVSGGCVFSADKQFWLELAESARGLAPVRYTIRGVNGASPSGVGESTSHELTFVGDDLTGGLYYWNAASGSIMRYDFGYPLQTASVFLKGNGPADCLGCHVLSRDGTRMAVGRGMPGLSYTVYDVATRTPLNVNGKNVAGAGSFFAFSAPDPTDFLFSGGPAIKWMDLTTGAIKNGNLTPGSMPDWSPAGDEIVYAKGGGVQGPTGVTNASLELLHFDTTNRVWNNPRTLVPFAGQNNYYPTFDPSGNWVLFNRSPGNHDSYENIGIGDGGPGDGELWMVNAKTGGNPIRLDRATLPGSTSWPKFAPALASYWGGSVVWITFSSERAYGLRKPENGGVQLWMTAIDLDKAQAGQDPSFPAFWLPFQDMKTGNHIAQWVTTVVRKPCAKSTDCEGGETCANGQCVPVIK
ncbi:MAG: hypothetical protein OZ921_09970 [Sorangiineae bacterium]|nr:hypothetical protein [Polyangiaceae bacterium]MEB2322831.1 hypothetical protein [Sorangiineae bacterium]